RRRVRRSGLLTPRRSSDEARDALQRVAQDVLCGTRCWQMNPDHRLHFDDARGEVDDALDATPARGAVEKLRETADFAVLGRRLEARLRLGFEVHYVLAQGRR